MEMKAKEGFRKGKRSRQQGHEISGTAPTSPPPHTHTAVVPTRIYQRQHGSTKPLDQPRTQNALDGSPRSPRIRVQHRTSAADAML